MTMTKCLIPPWPWPSIIYLVSLTMTKYQVLGHQGIDQVSHLASLTMTKYHVFGLPDHDQVSCTWSPWPWPSVIFLLDLDQVSCTCSPWPCQSTMFLVTKVLTIGQWPSLIFGVLDLDQVSYFSPHQVPPTRGLVARSNKAGDPARRRSPHLLAWLLRGRGGSFFCLLSYFRRCFLSHFYLRSCLFVKVLL